MEPLKNEWLIANSHKISAIQRSLVEMSYQGAPPGGIDLAAVNNMLGGAVLEITKLQKQVEELQAKLNAKREPEVKVKQK